MHLVFFIVTVELDVKGFSSVLGSSSAAENFVVRESCCGLAL